MKGRRGSSDDDCVGNFPSCAAKSSNRSRQVRRDFQWNTTRKAFFPIGSPCPLRCARYRHRWRESVRFGDGFGDASLVSPAVNRSHRPPGTASIAATTISDKGQVFMSVRHVGYLKLWKLTKEAEPAQFSTRVRGGKHRLESTSAFRIPGTVRPRICLQIVQFQGRELVYSLTCK